MKAIDNQTLAYVAGLMDGEGSIVIAVSKPSSKNGRKIPSHFLQVGIINTNREIINWLHDTFGGHISDNSHSTSRHNRRPCWAWRIMCNQAKEFLEKIYPFLKIKKQQAKLAIEFQEKRRGLTGRKSITMEQLKEREWYRQEIRKLTL